MTNFGFPSLQYSERTKKRTGLIRHVLLQTHLETDPQWRLLVADVLLLVLMFTSQLYSRHGL